MKGMLNHRRPPSRYPRTEAEGRAAMALCQYACAAPTQDSQLCTPSPLQAPKSHAGQRQGQAHIGCDFAGQPDKGKDECRCCVTDQGIRLASESQVSHLVYKHCPEGTDDLHTEEAVARHAAHANLPSRLCGGPCIAIYKGEYATCA